MGITRTTLAGSCAVLVAALLAGDLSAASPKDKLRAKKAQAEAVLVQVNKLNQSFEASVEAWHGARYQLQVTKQQLVVDRHRLKVAERQRRIAMAHVAERLRALYERGDDDSETDARDRARQHQHVGHARPSRCRPCRRCCRQEARRPGDGGPQPLRPGRERRVCDRARRTVAFQQRDRERRRIGAMLDERKRLLAGVQTEVAQLQAQAAAAEAARQARLRAAAVARLAEQARAQKAQGSSGRSGRPRVKTVTQPTTTASPTTTTTAAPPPPIIAPVTTTTATAAPVPTIPAGPGHPEAATIALRYLGIPYLWGGASPATGFDCSGLVMYVYAQLGISLPHYAAAQYQLGTPVDRSQLLPGDLVFFDALDHVGIYIGNGQFVHAPQTGDVVKITALADFGNGYVGARRL